MNVPLTRRELRALERQAELAEAPQEQQTMQVDLAPPPVPIEPPEPESQPNLTRRQMREMGLLNAGSSGSVVADSSAPQAAAAVEEQAQGAPEPSAPSSRRQIRDVLSEPLDAVLEEAPVNPTTFAPLDLPDQSIEEVFFTGANILSEPTTQSIILDTTTDAIMLPVDTGEMTITGSISIVSDPGTDSQPAGYDIDHEYTSQDAVVGVVSLVNPISASELIDQRSPVGVVPQSVLRRGWWKPWALALGALALAITAILSSITILGALGG